MEIIEKKNKSFPFMGLIVFESLIMFLCSILCGGVIYTYFPHWVDTQFLFCTKASIITICLFIWLLLYPKFICSKVWGLILITFLGGILFSVFFSYYGTKFCLIGSLISCLIFFAGLGICKCWAKKMSLSLFLNFFVGILILTFLHYIYTAYRTQNIIVCGPLYTAFVMTALLHLVFVFSHKNEIIHKITSSNEKMMQNRYVIFFYLNLLALAPFEEASRTVLLAFFAFIQLFLTQKL